MRDLRPRTLLPLLAALLAGAALVLPPAEAAPPPLRAPERPSLDDELERVRLEQELMRAERTARMLDDLQEALAGWDRVPREAEERAP